MNLVTKPKKLKEFRWQTDEKQAILISVKTQKTYQLNKTAFEIWRNCNGKRNINDIAILLNEKFPEVPNEELIQDIQEILSDMIAINLLSVEE